MIQSKSVNQILNVLTKFRARHSRGEPIIKAYQGAVDEVRKSYDVAYQTIGDLCRRRLQLRTINDFYNLLEQLVLGNCKPLMDVLMAHTRREDHHRIANYFNQEKPKGSVESPPFTREEGEAFTFRLGGDAAKKLKILSIEEGSSSEWLSKVVREILEERYKQWLRKQAQRELGRSENEVEGNTL